MLPSMPILFTRESQDAFGNKIVPSTSFFSQNSASKADIKPEPPPKKEDPGPSTPLQNETNKIVDGKKKEPAKATPDKTQDCALDAALVRSYYSKVQSRFSANQSVPTNKFVQFQSILKSFDPAKETPVDLYRKLEQLFGVEHRDFLEDFLLFLKPGQAAEVGRFSDHFMLTKMTNFIELLQCTLSRKPTVLRKVLRAIGSGLAGGSDGEMKARVLPHLRSNPKLAQMFKSLFPDERPPDSLYETGVDMLNESFLTDDKGYDVWAFPEDKYDNRKPENSKCLDTVEPMVPTQTQMKNTMGEPLAQVYFKSMSPKLKVLAGLQPALKGGGSDWYMPPYDILDSRAVLKPIKKEHLAKLSYLGIDGFSMKLVEDHQRRMEEEKAETLEENDNEWKRSIIFTCMQEWEDKSMEAAKANTEKIQQAFREFTTLYTTSITKVETLLFEAAVNEIKRVRQEAFQKMQEHYETLLKQQATMLYDRYEERLMKKKAALKDKFIKDVEEARTRTMHQVHDINAEKHVAIEKLRHLLECQTLACQVYVALKEREECEKEMELSKHEHKKKVKSLKEQIDLKDIEISLEVEKARRRREFNRIWQKKVCEVVKKLQIFVAFSLKILPDYADFFLNMEKLMMLQLEEAADNPSAESIFEPEPERIPTPVPRPHPYYVFCDKGYKPQIDPKLCPPHYTASAEQLPVVVINKRCIYAACDNFQLFTDKITEFINGRRGLDNDFIDDQVYANYFPVKNTSSTRLQELQLESSLMQVIQKERPNVKDVPIECCVCRIPHCFCSPLSASKMSREEIKAKKVPSPQSIPSGSKIETRSAELELEREPKWESYMEYVCPKKCHCAKTAKKHLFEHLPAYMRNMFSFDAPDLPNYVPCSVTTIKRLVRKAQGKRPPPPPPAKVPSKTRNVCTQTSDQEFERLCTCFSDDEIEKLLLEIQAVPKVHTWRRHVDHFKLVDGSVSDTHLAKQSASFATDRAMSLRQLVDDSPELEDIFRRDDCSFKSENSLPKP